MENTVLQHLDIFVLILSIGFFMFLEKRIPHKPYKSSPASSVFLVWLIGYLVNYLIMIPLVLILLIKLLASYKLGSLSHLDIPVGLSLLVSLGILDLCTYTMHRLSHKIPILWNLHKLHHSETRLSTATSLLHHPLELLVNSIWLLGFSMIFGISLWAILIYNILVISHAAFCHANISINQNISKKISNFLVTPAFHRVHHSQEVSLGYSNYGELLTIWDLIFRSHKQEALSYKQGFRYGVDGVFCTSPSEMLLLPFKQRKESK
jgi:sterol desaturase/sphingolipid hydroxylase (fatty acid hydroxylase superfamily)